jgi:two-component system cell cycle response regulator CtrA
MHILVVEPDQETSKSLSFLLGHAGFKVLSTDDPEDAVDLASLYYYDLIILETVLPDTTGFYVLRQIRTAKITTPVMMLSGDDSTASKIKAFGIGADDYVSKPFHVDELIARIRAIVRRSKGVSQPTISIGKLTIDLSEKSCLVDGKRVQLTTKEFDMLELMAMRQGTTVTKEMFLNHLYGGADNEPEIKIVDVFICKLRRKLSEATGGQEYIRTNWGRGYVFGENETLDRAERAVAAAHSAVEAHAL